MKVPKNTVYYHTGLDASNAKLMEFIPLQETTKIDRLFAPVCESVTDLINLYPDSTDVLILQGRVLDLKRETEFLLRQNKISTSEVCTLTTEEVEKIGIPSIEEQLEERRMKKAELEAQRKDKREELKESCFRALQDIEKEIKERKLDDFMAPFMELYNLERFWVESVK